MKSEELEREIEALLKRKVKFQDGLNQARADLREAQADLIDGNDAASEAATLAQATVTSLVGTLDFLNDRIETTREKLAEAEEAERIDATREKLTELRKIGEDAGKMITEAHERLNAVFEETITVLLEAGSRRDDARRAYQSLARTIGEDDDLPHLSAPPYDDVLIAQAVQTAAGRRDYRERTRRAAERRMATA